MLTWSKLLPRTPLVLLAMAEGLTLFASVYLAYQFLVDAAERQASIAPRAATVSVVMVICLLAMGLYQFHKRIYFHEVFARVVVALLVGSLVLAVAYYAVPALTLAPKTATISLVCALALLLVLRYAFFQLVDENIFRRRTLVLGAGDRTRPISELRRRADRRGFRVVGKIPAPGDRTINDCEHLLKTDKSLREIAIERRADEVVVAMDDRRGNLPIRDLLDCKMAGVDVIGLVEFLERETGKIRLDLVKPGWLIFSPGFRVNRLRRILTRSFDLVTASVALVVFAPLLILIALALKVFEGFDKPAIYKQRRVGHLGREFDVLKFRSMVVNAEADGRARWAEKDDPRVTNIGRVLRKSRLDELPQLFNVLAGDMSIVGPRPERPEFVNRLVASVPYYAERHTVKPGLTGWAQLKHAYGSSEDDALEKLQYDLYYLKNNSLILDLMIILQTVEVVLWGKGAR